MIDIEEIAYENGLELIDTTSAMNGYPQCLKKAIIGLDSFEEADKLAKENCLSIEIFTKRDGWNLWYRTGDKAWEPFERSAEEYGDDYREFSNEDLEEFYENEVQPSVSDFADFASLRSFLDNKEKIYDKIEEADDDELVITLDGNYYETIKKTTMSYCYDTHHFAIGLIDRN